MMNPRNLKLVIEYDGSAFCGWQIQPQGRTIQGTLTAAVSKIVNQPIKLICGGRTDTGVHARGQVANFHTTSTIPVYNLQRGINSQVYPDISIISIDEVTEDFHSRFSATSRWYRYHILRTKAPKVFEGKYSWHYPWDLKIEDIKSAATLFCGTHDFVAYNASPELTPHSVRTIHRFEINETNEFLIIDIEANAFLHHMVRSIVGTLIDVGRGKISPRQVKDILESRNRQLAGPTVPAHGLTLMKIYYQNIPTRS